MHLKASIFCMFWILINLISVLNGQNQYQILSGKNVLANICHAQATCGSCITASSACVWCAAENYNEPRCDYQNNLLRNGCPEATFQNPINSLHKIQDRELSNKSNVNVQYQDTPIQLRPQHVFLRLRPLMEHYVKLDFKQAADYPVDLYYLMDLSKSMEDDKDKLSELGMILSEEMQLITSNFRLGFGSFVDKVVMPYVNTVPEKLKAPCSECASPYGFINHMTLGNDASLFSRRVNETRISGNLDAPEGGFDAIMQSIVCGKQIGWRNRSRRLLLFSTDSGFHYAGDGKLGGIIKPNDGVCHLNAQGKYTESETQDYPSISQINAKVRENAVNIIFAVTQAQIDIYKQLVPLVEGSSAGELKNDSSNVVELVKAEYQKITSTIELRHDLKSSLSDYIRIKFYSKCLGTNKMQRDKCLDIPLGTQVTFDVKLELLKCPENPNEWNQTIHIRTVGLQDELVIDLQMLCDCDCEKPNAGEENSERCSGHGIYQCGICACDSSRYGRTCECDAKESNPLIEEEKCRHKNDTRICSGHGQCRCGICECNHKYADGLSLGVYSGDFCECDNWDCPRKGGLICSGPDHGKCECGRCICNSQYTNDDCSCPASNESCMRPGDKELCSGRGICECGVCKCNSSDKFYYSGAWCEDCPSCPTECQLYKDCVRCQVWGTGPINKEACTNTSILEKNSPCDFIVIQADEVEADENMGEKLCEFIDDADDCRFRFKYYGIKDVDPIIVAKRTKDCPKVVNILAIVLGVIVGIVLVGLALLLIWKLLTTIHDRREFAKFEKERQMAKWDTGENPIYKQATTTFRNPTYGGKQ